MTTYILRRLWQFVPTLLGVVLLVFFLFNWVGGDPAYMLAGKIANPEHIENIRRQIGVDQPYYIQLWIFVKQIATGDFGASWATNEKISSIFATRLGPSVTVLLPMLVISTLIAMAAAMLVAYRRGTLTDRSVMVGSSARWRPGTGCLRSRAAGRGCRRRDLKVLGKAVRRPEDS